MYIAERRSKRSKVFKNLRFLARLLHWIFPGSAFVTSSGLPFGAAWGGQTSDHASPSTSACCNTISTVESAISGGILVFAQYALDHQPQASSHAFKLGPIHCDVLAQIFGQLVGNLLQGFVREFAYGRIMCRSKLPQSKQWKLYRFNWCSPILAGLHIAPSANSCLVV